MDNLSVFTPEFPAIANPGVATAQTLLLGQQRAIRAFRSALNTPRPQHLYGVSFSGLNTQLIIQQLLQQVLPEPPKDCSAPLWVYGYVPQDSNIAGVCLSVAADDKQLLDKLVKFTEAEKLQVKLAELRRANRFSQQCEPLLDWLHRVTQQHYLPQLMLLPEAQQRNASAMPIVFCDPLTEADLFGELFSYGGNGTTLHWRCSLGALHRAHGGILVLNAEYLAEQPEMQQRLYSVLQNGALPWRYNTNCHGVALAVNHAAIDVRVVLVGGRYALEQLQFQNSMFEQLFPLIAEFDDRVSIKDHQSAYCDYLQTLASVLGLKPLTAPALDVLLPYCSRLCEHNDYLTLASHTLGQLLTMADAEAKTNPEIDASHIEQTLNEQRDRTRMLAERSYRDFAEGTLLMETTGKAVGQVNGLSVVDIGHVTFGEPTRITVSVHYGDGDVIDIERKAELAGNIHAKGTMILSSYLASLFSKDAPLHLSASVVFEQSYSEVDGDSASLAELIALLSAIARIPVAQDVGITGAIDQFGNVLAIGGVNEKIEGFYDVAISLDDGPHRVVIPTANARQLNLRTDVANACKQGRLQIFAVEHVKEAVQLLLGTPAGELIADSDRYPEGSVFGTVQKRFEQLLREQDELKAEGWFSRLLRRLYQ